MFDEKTILARLQNGEDIQKIANEMAAVINTANETYNKQKAEEAAKAKRAEDLQGILDLLAEWIADYYNMDVEELKADLTAESIIELMDSCYELVASVGDLEKMLGGVQKKAMPVKVKIANGTADKTIEDFLQKMGW
jgi:hypothetical protein